MYKEQGGEIPLSALFVTYASGFRKERQERGRQSQFQHIEKISLQELSKWEMWGEWNTTCWTVPLNPLCQNFWLRWAKGSLSADHHP